VHYLVVILLFLTGCGFKPLYSQNNIQPLNGVTYQRLADHKNNARATFLLNEKIERMLTSNMQSKIPAKYVLSVDYEIKVDDYMTMPGSVSTRKRVQIFLHYILRDIKTDQIKHKGKIMDFNSFSVTKRQPFSDYLNQDSLTINMLNSLVEELRIQLIAKLAN
jgi:hypothetical protein